MTCQTCGRPAENGVATHWLGCESAPRVITLSAGEARDALSAALQNLECEHEGCSKPKKDWSGRGARPKFCAAGHK